MNYPKEFYVTVPIVGDKVWLDIEIFTSGNKAFHGPWWITSIHPMGVSIRRQNGTEAVVGAGNLLRMSKTQIKKMAVLDHLK